MSEQPQHHEAPEEQQDERPAQEAAPSPAPQRVVVEPFEPRRFAWQIQRDLLMRIGVGVAAIGVLVALAVFDAGGSAISLAATVMVVVGWVSVSVISARVMRELPEVTALVDADPEQAEAGLSRLLARKPLMRWVRLALYHRLAAVRHHQGRFAECGAICRSVLSHRLGPAEASRSHLLLLLAEASLAAGDMLGAHAALSSLHATRMSLTEALQKLALQTRYEAAIGADDATMWALEHKVALVELMPAPQCGAVHVLLAQSADRLGLADTAQWLWARARLLCGPEVFEALRQGQPGIGVVGGVPEYADEAIV